MIRRGTEGRGTPDRSRQLSVHRGTEEQSTPDRSLAPIVRRGTEDDVPALERMLGRAFRDDPVVVWACRSSALRPAVLAAINDARLRQLLAHKEVWVAPESTSAALWTPPGQGHMGLLQSAGMARGMLRPRLAACLPRLALGLACMQRQHPRDPHHWYLSRLATDPGSQGRGLGSAVLQPVLQRCDGEGVGAHLETAVERNLGFYSRHGFRVSGEVRLPRGPTIWSMWREPQPRR